MVRHISVSVETLFLLYVITVNSIIQQMIGSNKGICIKTKQKAFPLSGCRAP